MTIALEAGRANERPQVRAGRSIVDALIEERAPGLTGRQVSAALLRRWLYPILSYPQALHFADQIADLDGSAVMDLAARELALRLEIRGDHQIPRQGRAILVANHPTGIADGIALWSALGAIRPDLVFMANADAIRVAPGLADLVVPVDWIKARRSHVGSRAALQQTARALQAERLVIMFPSGRLAHLTWRGLRERPWMPTVINIARKYQAPVVPLHISARNSPLFYALSLISQELRDITLFNELLNKRGKPFRLTFGAPIDPAALDGASNEEATLALKAVVEHELKPKRIDRLRPYLRYLMSPA